MKTVIEMAKEAGNDDLFDAMQVAFLERLVEIARAEEREACALLIEENVQECSGLMGLVLQANADAIRARGSNT